MLLCIPSSLNFLMKGTLKYSYTGDTEHQRCQMSHFWRECPAFWAKISCPVRDRLCANFRGFESWPFYVKKKVKLLTKVSLHRKKNRTGVVLILVFFDVFEGKRFRSLSFCPAVDQKSRFTQIGLKTRFLKKTIRQRRRTSTPDITPTSSPVNTEHNYFQDLVFLMQRKGILFPRKNNIYVNIFFSSH